MASPTAERLARQIAEAFPQDDASRSHSQLGHLLWSALLWVFAMSDPTPVTLAEHLLRAHPGSLEL